MKKPQKEMTWLELRTKLLELGVKETDIVGAIIITQGDSFRVVIEDTSKGRQFSVLTGSAE